MTAVTESTVLLPESYVVEIDGQIRSGYQIYTDALKAGLELKREFPLSHIKVHELRRFS
jgi:hypothetical protein